MTVGEWAKEPGVSDLNSAVKVKFIKALMLESDGKHDEAYKYLNDAISKQEELDNLSKK
jgi:hypothetical protein